MKTINKKEMPQLLNTWARANKVFVPMYQDGFALFAPWREEAEEELALEVISTRLSPKGLFFPQTERLFYFKTGDEGELQFIPEKINTDPVMVVGIRGCDVQALQSLDALFLTRGYTDAAYKAARERTTVVSMGCNQPLDTCFCTSMGVNPMEAAGSDLVIYDLGETYGFKAQTPKGESALAAVGQLLRESDVRPPQAAPCRVQLDLEGVPQHMVGMFEHPVWEKLSQRCLGCGTCTYVCPSCHCFDIQGKTRGDKGFRYRCWDACMYNDYALMAGGHDPRPTLKERVRQRFMHKLRYFPERYGEYLCSGCGRCLQHCPVGIDIIEAAQAVLEDKAQLAGKSPATGKASQGGEVANHGK